MSKKSETEQAPQFETALAELESLVEELEAGELDLAESLQKFERGVKLARECQGALAEAEQKIRLLGDGESAGDASDD